MNKEQIKERLLTEKNAKLIDVLEINNRCYAKALIVSTESIPNFVYKYYEITTNNINEIDETLLENVKQLFETNLGNVVY